MSNGIDNSSNTEMCETFDIIDLAVAKQQQIFTNAAGSINRPHISRWSLLIHKTSVINRCWSRDDENP